MQKKVAIFGRVISKECGPTVQEIIHRLLETGTDFIIFEEFYQFLKKSDDIPTGLNTFSDHAELASCDFAISIGGDGTLLETITYVRDKNIPVMGINAGRLGFLATIAIDQAITSLNALLKGEFELEERILVQCDTGGQHFGDINFALNEFAIQKRDSSSMIVVHTYIDGEFLNSYWVDGLIISTPTGSTGYSLSCGGPLVMPKTNNFIIAPVNPHNLNVRPMVVPDSSVVTFKIEGRANKVLLSLDSRSKSANMDVSVTVKKADFGVKLVSFKDSEYFNTLRNKLNWGLDIRN